MAIRIDANGAWSVEEAITALRALEPVGVECCEEPVSGALAIAHVVERTAIPIARTAVRRTRSRSPPT